MRVLQVHNSYRFPGGEDRVVAEEAEVLREAGHHVDQWVVSNPTGVMAIPALLGSVWNPVAAVAASRLETKLHPDVVHVHNTWFALSVAAVKAIRAPVVMTLHNFRLTCANAILFRDGGLCVKCVKGSPWNGVRYGCYRGPLLSIPAAANISLHRRLGTWPDSVSLFLALNAFARDTLIEAGLPPDRVVIKPHFVKDPGKRLAPPASSDQVLYVGRLEQAKGIEMFARAWNAARPNLRLVVVGDGPSSDLMSSVHNVELLGLQPPSVVADLMRNSRALVVPSLSPETHPLVVLEAFAAGLPVMASDQIGLRDQVQRLSGNWLVRAGREPDWVAALIRLTNDPLVDAAGSEARALYEGAYTPQHGIRALEDIYRRVAQT